MTSLRIMKTEDFQYSVFYRAACSCGSDEHDITLILEHDEDIPSMINLVMHKDLAWCSYWGGSWWQRLKRRIFGPARMLFTGYVEVEETFIFQGKEQIEEFISALNEGIEKLEKEEDDGMTK